jgi:hypothetical protein
MISLAGLDVHEADPDARKGCRDHHEERAEPSPRRDRRRSRTVPYIAPVHRASAGNAMWAPGAFARRR